jgi:hypothetical protein
MKQRMVGELSKGVKDFFCKLLMIGMISVKIVGQKT